MARSAFITGVSSFAGGHLARQLIDAGWSVEGTVNSRRSGIEGVTEHRVDIADGDAIAGLIEAAQPDAVFHLAAIVDTVDTPSVTELQRVNVLGAAAVVEAVRAAAPTARLVYTSSAFVYGFTAPDEQPVVEGQSLRPLTPYGASKVAAEAIVGQYARAGGNAVITRAFQHTGNGHVGAYALSDWAEQLARIKSSGGSGSIATGNLDVERDYLDVRDVAAAYLALADAGETGDVFNVSSDVPVTMRALLEGLIAAFDVDVEITTDQSRLRKIDQPRFVGDSSRLRAATGWAPSYEISQTLDELARFWLSRV